MTANNSPNTDAPRRACGPSVVASVNLVSLGRTFGWTVKPFVK
jgi:hypothetical protein